MGGLPLRERHRIARFVASGACTVITGVCVLSGFCAPVVCLGRPGRACISLRGGEVQVMIGEGETPLVADLWPMWLSHEEPMPRVSWWQLPHWWRANGSASLNGYNAAGAEIPLWLILAPTLAATLWAWRSRGRWHPPAGCRSCGYDRSGLPPGGACPECGKGTTANAAKQRGSI